MMRWIRIIPLLWSAALFTPMTQQAASANDTVGVRQMTAPSKERDGSLDVTVWYPASTGGKSMILGENIFFVGTSAMLDAPISDDRFPLVLLSHGAGLAGSADAISWIAAPLAKQGFIVAAPTHPGNTGVNRSAAETMKLWLRPMDLTETLDFMEKEPFFQTHIRLDDVGVLGLSMGGGTALALAGARIDANRLAAYCDTDALNPSLCDWVRESKVDLRAMDMGAAGRDNIDKRIRFAMAVDPAPVDVFEVKTLREIEIPVELVNLGRAAEIPSTAQAAEIAKAIPGAQYSTIEDASHYSMFAECKPGAAEIAVDEDIGDPICADGGLRSRHEIHLELINTVAAAFERTLKHGR